MRSWSCCRHYHGHYDYHRYRDHQALHIHHGHGPQFHPDSAVTGVQGWIAQWDMSYLVNDLSR